MSFSTWWFLFLCWQLSEPSTMWLYALIDDTGIHQHAQWTWSMSIASEISPQSSSFLSLTVLTATESCHHSGLPVTPSSSSYTFLSFTVSLRILEIDFSHPVSLSLDLPQFPVCTSNTFTCLSLCFLVLCFSTARLDGRNSKMIQAEPIKRSHKFSFGINVAPQAICFSFVQTLNLLSLRLLVTVSSLFWLSILPSFTSKFMTKIFTVLPVLLCILGHVALHLSLPPRPLLPSSRACNSACLQFSGDCLKALSYSCTLHGPGPCFPLLCENRVSFQRLKMKATKQLLLSSLSSL